MHFPCECIELCFFTPYVSEAVIYITRKLGYSLWMTPMGSQRRGVGGQNPQNTVNVIYGYNNIMAKNMYLPAGIR